MPKHWYTSLKFDNSVITFIVMSNIYLKPKVLIIVFLIECNKESLCSTYVQVDLPWNVSVRRNHKDKFLP